MLVIYALGGGWGHLTRAVALARIARDATIVLTNSPYANQIRAVEQGVAIEETTRDQVVSRIRDLAPAVLVVDTFPRGLGGELTAALADIAARKILVHRDLEPRYVEWAKLREFVAHHYDLVLVPGPAEGGSFVDKAVTTEPWLVRAVQDLSPQRECQILICAGGNADELRWYGEVAARIPPGIDFRCIAPERPPGCPAESWVRHWPGIEWIAGARVAIGGAGYNTVHECRACGVPLVAKPWPRKYDRQQRRAAVNGVISVGTPSEAVAAARDILTRNSSFPAGPGGPPIQAAALL